MLFHVSYMDGIDALWNVSNRSAQKPFVHRVAPSGVLTMTAFCELCMSTRPLLCADAVAGSRSDNAVMIAFIDKIYGKFFMVKVGMCVGW